MQNPVVTIEMMNGDVIKAELYPEVAARCNGTPSQVERSIRSAIATAWKNRDETLWRRYFMPDKEGTVPKPTNADFITRVADVLTVSEKENNAQRR